MSSVREEADADLCTGLLGERPRGMGTATDGLKGPPPGPRAGPELVAPELRISAMSFSLSRSSTGDSSVRAEEANQAGHVSTRGQRL